MRRIMHRPRKALVTGASGFIGSHVVRRLLEEGVEVRAMLMPEDPAPNLEGLDIERVPGDILDAESVRAAVEGCDTVFHLAAIYAVWHPRPELIYEVNIRGTVHVVEAAAELGVRRVVHTSSIAAVGTRGENMPADEDTLFNTWLDANPYVWSKYISELEAFVRAGRTGLHLVAVNPTFPFGPGDVRPTPTGQIVLSLLQGKLPVWFDGGFNAVDVRDVAEGHWLAALRGAPGERYLLGGHNLTYRGVMELVGELADVKPPRIKVSRRTAVALGFLSEKIFGDLAHRTPLFTRGSLAYSAERYLLVDIGKAQRDLGYRPRPLSETVRDAVAWFRSPEFAHAQQILGLA